MAGLSREQRRNVDRVLGVGRKIVPGKKQKKLFKAAILTIGTEANFRHVKGGDRDSSGAFQQRPSQGWGPASESLEKDASQFFRAALRAAKPGMSSAKIAQAVQRSAFPGRYAKHSGTAEDILRKGGASGRGPGYKKLGVEIGQKESFDQPGFEHARRQAIVGNLISRRRGTGGVLFKTGLLTTQMPSKEDFMSTALSSKVVSEGRVKGERLSSGGHGVTDGGGYMGTEKLAGAARRVARQTGHPIVSQKRSKRNTASGNVSDHFIGNKRAWAVDIGATGEGGARLARKLARTYGIQGNVIGTYDRHPIKVGNRRYSVQILWAVEGHFDHVHAGFRRES